MGASILNSKVLVLNRHYLPVHVTVVRRALSLLYQDIARAVDEGEPLPDHPHRMIEENTWRAIRYGLSGELIDLATLRVRSARAALEELVEWMLPVADELGVTPFLKVPAANAAERQIARYEEGATLETIYAEQVAETAAVPRAAAAG